jgi:LacI family transcriptional regulator
MNGRSIKGASIVKVAAEAGVSTATAGRVLGGYGQVSEQAAAKVRAAAERLAYRPNSLARSLIHGSTKTVAVVVTDVGNPFFAQAVRGIIEAVRAAGYEVLLFDTASELDVERRAITTLWEKRVDGAVIAATSPDDVEHLRSLVDGHLPVVLLDRPIPSLPELDTVAIANSACARTAVGHLVRLGHRRIAIVTEAADELRDVELRLRESDAMRPSAARLAGYLMALQSARIPLEDSLVVASPYERGAAERATRRLLARDPDVTAIFATDNVIAIGAFQAIQASGRRFPEDVSMVGFDDQEWTTMVRPQLTVVRQPSRELGTLAGDLLVARMSAVPGRSAPRPSRILESLEQGNWAPQHLTLPAKLVKRGSTMPGMARVRPGSG